MDFVDAFNNLSVSGKWQQIEVGKRQRQRSLSFELLKPDFPKECGHLQLCFVPGLVCEVSVRLPVVSGS